MPSASTSSSIDDSAPLAAIARAIERDARSSPSSPSSRDADDGVARAVAALLDATADSQRGKNAPADAAPRPRPPKPDWGCARCGTRVNVVRWHSADAKWYYHHSRTRMCRRCNREHEARARGRREAAAPTTTTTRDDDLDDDFIDGADDDGTASDDDGTDDDARGGRVARSDATTAVRPVRRGDERGDVRREDATVDVDATEDAHVRGVRRGVRGRGARVRGDFRERDARRATANRPSRRRRRRSCTTSRIRDVLLTMR